MKSIQVIVHIAVALGVVASTHARSLEEGFKTPPPDARPQTWYHLMNGNVTKAGITRDFEEMARLGLGGVQIFDVGCDIPPGDVKFGSPEWFDLLRHAHNEAKRFGLKLGIHNCSGWSSSGGPWVTPADAMKVTMHAEFFATGPSRFSRKLSRIKRDNGFYADIAELAYPTIEKGATLSNANGKTGRSRKGMSVELSSLARDTKEFPAAMVIAKGKIIDITSKMTNDGTLTWDVPAGKWTIFRLGYICNGRRNRLPSKDGDGLEVDKFSAAAFDRHFDAYMGRLCREVGLQRRSRGDRPTTVTPPPTGLSNIHIDSWEVGCQNWTHGLEKTFEKRVGYSIIPYLPVLAGHVVGSVDESERFCEDFRRLLADLLAENYAGRMAERCHEYGLKFTCEPYGPSNADDLQYGEKVDVPMSCFWMDGTCGPGKFPCMDNSHYAASLAHVWGRRYAADEAFTAGPPNGGRWLETPFSIKWQNDRAFAKGCNLIVYHRFTHQPWTDDKYLPGMTMGRWGMHLDRTQTWWHLADGWFRYQARCQWMLQEGRFVADALYWNGEEVPKHGWPKIDLPSGYEFDVCATKVVEQLKVRNGKVVVPGGVEYEILVLPDGDTMTERMVKRVGELVDAGARVVAPRRPVRAPGLGRARTPAAQTASVQQQEGSAQTASVQQQAGVAALVAAVPSYRALVDAVWAKGVLECSPTEALQRLGVEPDFACDLKDVAWIHRTGRARSPSAPPYADWYFVACGSATNVSFEASFRIAGKVPEIWNAETGEIRAAATWRVEGGRTVVRLDFPPSGSAFVVLRRESGESGKSGNPGESGISGISGESGMSGKSRISGPWQVSFPIDWYTGGSAMKTFDWPALKDWTSDADPDVKYFSGTATYRKRFALSPSALSLPSVGRSPRDRRIFLDLGNVKDFAEVEVNGKSYPPLWRPPFRVDITDAVKTASVQQQDVAFTSQPPVQQQDAAITSQQPLAIDLEIRITNLWPNRLIGDETLYPPDCEWALRWHGWQKLNEPGIKEIPQWVKDGKPSPTGRHTFTTWKHWTKDDALLPSGLLGPVVIESKNGFATGSANNATAFHLP